MKRVKFGFIVACLSLLTQAFASAQSPSLTSGLPDYPPGATAILMGADFLPGRATVAVQISTRCPC